MKTCAVVGINWGDEGKGRMVDLLTEQYDIVIRYQGGGNAGHTVINEKGKFALHLLPSGIFREGVVNILGNGVAVDPDNLWKEIQYVAAEGVAVTPDNLKVSDRASLLMPWHRDLDALEEARLADKQYGSTKQGIAPFYSVSEKNNHGRRVVSPGKTARASAGHSGVEESDPDEGVRGAAVYDGDAGGLDPGLLRTDQAICL